MPPQGSNVARRRDAHHLSDPDAGAREGTNAKSEGRGREGGGDPHTGTSTYHYRCRKDFSGLFFVVLVWAVAISGTWSSVYLLIFTSQWSLGAKIAAASTVIALAGLCLAAHTLCVICPPGYLANINKSPGNNKGPGNKDDEGGSLRPTPEMLEELQVEGRWCRKCDSYKSPAAHHCSVCSRCVVKMDHHCPWLNNCIGVYNQRNFILFNFYSLCLALAGVAVITARLLHCRHYNNNKPPTWLTYKLNGSDTPVLIADWMPNNSDSCGLNVKHAMGVLVVAIESLLFGIFSLAMLVEQIANGRRGLSGIDVMKADDESLATRESSWRNFSMLMGAPHCLLWLPPYQPSKASLEQGLTQLDRLCLRGSFASPAFALELSQAVRSDFGRGDLEAPPNTHALEHPHTLTRKHTLTHSNTLSHTHTHTLADPRALESSASPRPSSVSSRASASSRRGAIESSRPSSQASLDEARRALRQPNHGSRISHLSSAYNGGKSHRDGGLSSIEIV